MGLLQRAIETYDANAALAGCSGRGTSRWHLFRTL